MIPTPEQIDRLEKSAASNFALPPDADDARVVGFLCRDWRARQYEKSNDPCETVFIGEGGYGEERGKACAVFTKGAKYRVVGGSMSQSSCSIQIEGMPGSWNSVLFDINIHACPAIKNGYKHSAVSFTAEGFPARPNQICSACKRVRHRHHALTLNCPANDNPGPVIEFAETTFTP